MSDARMRMCRLALFFIAFAGSFLWMSAAKRESGRALAAEEMLVGTAQPASEQIFWDETWAYASFSAIHTDPVTLYRSPNRDAVYAGTVVAVNAGHGTSGGSSVKTQCHPDGTPKVTGGSTAAGETMATAVSAGTTMLDGTPEAQVNLRLAEIVRERLLEAGFDVLMIRESEDVQLDNIARTVFANQCANCHLAIHYDGTASDKGFFYMSVPKVESYLNMEPVASHWQDHDRLGECILSGMRTVGVKIFEGGSMEMDLTQTSYSTVPSVDIEMGDTASDVSDSSLELLAGGIVGGVQLFYTQYP